MSKRVFFSILFRRNINPDEKEYWLYVKAEVIYRIFDLKEKNCHCMKCSEDLNKLEEFYSKFKNKDLR